MKDHRVADKQVTTLSPKYTYAIFGETEKIFGFKDLSIDISIAADTLLTLLEIKYTERIPVSIDAEAEDLEGTLTEFLPPDLIRSRSQWTEACSQASTSFEPPGSRVEEYDTNASQYQIHRASLADESVRPLLERMQLFSLLYIEGATLIDTSDDRFELWTIFAKQDEKYEFVGYCTCYKYQFYDKVDHTFDHLRYRISQFIIMPHHQGNGHGGRLYDAIVKHCLADSSVVELTVEDPSEQFDDLRDRRDMSRLQAARVFDDSTCAYPIADSWKKSTQRQNKLVKRQFARLLEMGLLARLEEGDKKATKNYRQLVKSRLYKKNRDILAELEPQERLQKLEETYQSQVEDYLRLLGSVKKPTARASSADETSEAKRRKLES